jgi:hypothetical protein
MEAPYMYLNILAIVCLALFILIPIFIISYHKKHPKITWNELKTLIARLQNEGKDKEIRDNILDKLKKVEFSKKQRFFLLQSASYPYPEVEHSWEDISNKLFSLAVKVPSIGFIEEIKRAFPTLSKRAKSAGLRYLLKNSSEVSIKTYMDIVRTYYMDIEDLPTLKLDQSPQYVKLIFPEMYGFVRNKKISANIYLLVLNFRTLKIERSRERI